MRISDRIRGLSAAPRFCLILALLTIAACSAPSEPVPIDTGPVTITWYLGPITQGAGEPRQALVDSFERAYPGIHIDLRIGLADTDAERAQLHDEIINGAGPDVYLGDIIWAAEFAHDGIAAPLDPAIPLPPGFLSGNATDACDTSLSAPTATSFWQNFDPCQVRTLSYQDHVYGVPLFTDVSMLYYRKDLLAEAGLPVPTTWEQLVHDSQRLRAMGLASQFVWQGDDYEGLICNWLEYLSDAGGATLRIAPDTTDVVAGDLDSPQALRALTFMRQLISSGTSPAAVTTYMEAAAVDTFTSGGAAFLRDWSSGYLDATTNQPAGNVGVAPLPTFDGTSGPGYSTLGGWDLYVNPHSAHVQAALTFAQWIGGNVAQEIIAEYDEVPANLVVLSGLTSAPNDVAVARQITAAHRVVYRPENAVSASTHQFIPYSTFSNAVVNPLHTALNPNSSDRQAAAELTEANKNVNTLINNHNQSTGH